MAQINLEKLTLRELVELQERVGPAIRDAQARERAAAREKLDKMAQQLGFNVKELYGSRRQSGPVKVKYANPDNASETWTGRGRTPNWLRAKLDKGAKLDSFAL